VRHTGWRVRKGHAMRTLMAAVAVAVGLGFAGMAYANCGHCGADKPKTEEHAWCKHCGETDKTKCCTEAEKCEKCGLHKGSPGCQHECAPAAK
jgi:hypothetical protein